MNVQKSFLSAQVSAYIINLFPTAFLLIKLNDAYEFIFLLIQVKVHLFFHLFQNIFASPFHQNFFVLHQILIFFT